MTGSLCMPSPFLAEVVAGFISAGGLLLVTLAVMEVWSRMHPD